MGYEGIAKLCNPVVLGIINELQESPNTQKLADLVIDIYGAQNILEEVESRRLVFEYLDRPTAARLAQHLKLNVSDDHPWRFLTKAKFTTEKIDLLLDFFDIQKAIACEKTDSEIDFCKLVSAKYGLFPHQEDAARKIKQELIEDRAKVLLHMPTGAGKTRTAMSIACDYIRNRIDEREKSLVVWLADTEELCDQAATEFERAWEALGVGETKVYRVQGSISADLNDVDYGFVVVSLQKLNAISKDQQKSYYSFCARTKLVIFDEAHKAIADTYRHSINMFQAVGSSKVLGLSATPGRSTFDSQKNKIFAEFFNHKKITLEIAGYENPILYLQEKGYLAQVKYTDIPYSADNILLTELEIQSLYHEGEPKDDLLRRLGADQKRNLKILNIALEQVKCHRKTILFAPSVECAEGLFALLRYKEVRAGLITSKTSTATRRAVINQYKSGGLDVLVNYGVLTTGFDAPITNVAIIARPTNSLTLFSQMVGRAIRGVNAGGNKEANVFVIKDTLPGLRDMTTTFSYWDNSWGN